MARNSSAKATEGRPKPASPELPLSLDADQVARAELEHPQTTAQTAECSLEQAHFQREQAVTAKNRMLAGLLQAAPDAIVLCDGIGNIVCANPQAHLMFGHALDELSGHSVDIFVPARFRAAYRRHLAESSVQPQPSKRRFDIQALRKDGSEFLAEISLGALKNETGPLVISIIRDASERHNYEQELIVHSQNLEEANARLQELATSDGLTGLKNRRALRERLEEEFRRAVRHQTPFSLLMLDLDHFKQYNDDFGHLAGDEALKSVAQRLRENARDIDFVARYGGEEFVILLPFTDRRGAVKLAERFRSTIATAIWKERPLTVSVGVATLAEPFTSSGTFNANSLLDTADKALYHSKDNGRNRVTHAADLTPLTAPTPFEKPDKKPLPAGRRSRHPPSKDFKTRVRSLWRGDNVFLFLLGARWLSLLPPALELPGAANTMASRIFALALFSNILLTVFHPKLNRLVMRTPIYLALDMASAAVFIAMTGGTASPYEFYALTPLLAAVFFFQIRGGLLAAAVFMPFYLGATAFARQQGNLGVAYWPVVFGELLNFSLTALVFGYLSSLLRRLHTATIQLQQAQQEAARAETLAAIGKMTAKVSHEIRNPLGVLGGLARSLLRKPDEVERVRENARIIADEALRLEQLLGDLLDLSRPRSLARQPVDLHEVLDKAWLLAGGVSAGHAAIRKDYDVSLPSIKGDPSALLSVFLNVLRNAVQVTPPEGTITISTHLLHDGPPGGPPGGPPSAVEIRISDDGPGIPPELLPHIFPPFVSQHPNGTGLGLAVTHEIIEQHGGRIEAHSQPGQGAQFICRFPLVANA